MVPPTPVATTVKTSFNGIVDATATRMLTVSSATKAWILKRMIMTSKIAMPMAAMVSSSGVPRSTAGLMGGTSAARTSKELIRGFMRGVSPLTSLQAVNWCSTTAERGDPPSSGLGNLEGGGN